jgi:SAM-dependent methyltransferase
VVNVESSRCYPHIDRFLAEVKRVLRPDGDFLITDMRWKADVESLRQQFADAGFTIVDQKPIRENVVRALNVDDERKLALIRSKVPRFLLKTFAEFAGTRGSSRYRAFESGDMEYWSFHLRHR